MRAIVFLIVLLACSVLGLAQNQQSAETTVKAIRAICGEIEESPSIFVNEIKVNRDDRPFPAVGKFQSRIEFVYTYGDREKNPYPDRLLRVFIKTDRSAVVESQQFCFDDRQRLIFFYSKDADHEYRLYFSNGSIVRALDGDKILTGTTATPVGKRAIADAGRLSSIFAGTLKF